MKTKTVLLSEIRSYENNPREIDAAIDGVVASIKKVGYIQPITVNAENIIITGHTRYFALERLGVKEVDVIELNLSKKDEKKYRIADNKVREKSSWDNEKINIELRAIEGISDAYTEAEIKKMDDSFMGTHVDTVNEADITRAEKKLGKQKMNKNTLLSVTCPNCKNEFSIKP